jgi:hypothetical protein
MDFYTIIVWSLHLRQTVLIRANVSRKAYIGKADYRQNEQDVHQNPGQCSFREIVKVLQILHKQNCQNSKWHTYWNM